MDRPVVLGKYEELVAVGAGQMAGLAMGLYDLPEPGTASADTAVPAADGTEGAPGTAGWLGPGGAKGVEPIGLWPAGGRERSTANKEMLQ